MKLQGVAIIFIMIAFPMILVLSYYLGLQIDTIKLQTSYDNKLIDATSDALAAFEINTANEDLSAASDSLRSIVNASATTFTNTLGTSLGLSNASKERIREYIPSILFTLYDGYYIYAPTEVPVISEKKTTVDGIVTSEGADYELDGSVVFETDGGGTTTDSTQASTEQDYVLKSYMPYSATYVSGGNRATINYTLDNFMSISAQMGEVYYTKSGYYIAEDLVDDWTPWINMGQDQIKEYCESGANFISITVNGIDIIYTRIQKEDETGALVFDAAGLPIYYTMEELDKELEVEYKNYQNLISANPRDDTDINNSVDRIRDLEVSIANLKAITYYLTNTAFSKWVNSNLTFVSGSTLTNDDGDTYNVGELTDNRTNIYYDFQNDGPIFNVGNPEEPNSTFNNHKYNIIKNAIQYNLNLAMSAYNQKYVSSHDFRMPMLTDNEWEQITQKVSIVSFMQGLPCGTKTYTGYSVVSSTNNELTVTPEEIYYLNRNEFNNEISYYHRIDCPNAVLVANTISFKSKEVKYDKIYNKHTSLYNYDHKNLACYNCIVQNNYENDSLDIDGDGSNYMSFQDYIENMDANRKRAYYIAVGKERQNLYKTTGYSRNEGMRTDLTSGSSLTLTETQKISQFEITIEVDTLDYSRIVDKLQINGDNMTEQAISTTSTFSQTVVIKNNDYISLSIGCENGTTIDILSIKAIYK